MPRNMICAALLAFGLSVLLHSPLDPFVSEAGAVDTHTVGQDVQTPPVRALKSFETAPAEGAQQMAAQPTQESSEAVGSLPATLSSEFFTGEVKEGYQIAEAIPDILAGLRCYCGCDRSMRHRNLLDCFVDDHAAG